MPVGLGLVSFHRLPDLHEPEQLLSLLAQKHLSLPLQVLFLGALVSAILSTVDSTLLAAAALASHNLIVPLRKTMGEAAKVNLARVGSAAESRWCWPYNLTLFTSWCRVRRHSEARGFL
jgi:Na+/pantothenate symporter